MTHESPDGRLAEPDAADEGLLRVIPGLARVVVASGVRTLQWAAATSFGTAQNTLRAVASGKAPTRAMVDAAAELRAAARSFLGIGAGDDLRRQPAAVPTTAVGKSAPTRRPASAEELRARGTRLLHDSADVFFHDGVHPAYERILDELSPDEARILRLLATDGPQPSIDVRTNRPLGVGSELVASGLSMIGLHAGVRNIDRTRAQLNNLERLGLVWFSREPVDDPQRYQVVEVQPDVQEACRKAGRSPKTVHRSIHLTPFGEDFCTVCLPLDGQN